MNNRSNYRLYAQAYALTVTGDGVRSMFNDAVQDDDEASLAVMLGALHADQARVSRSQALNEAPNSNLAVATRVEFNTAMGLLLKEATNG